MAVAEMRPDCCTPCVASSKPQRTWLPFRARSDDTLLGCSPPEMQGTRITVNRSLLSRCFKPRPPVERSPVADSRHIIHCKHHQSSIRMLSLIEDCTRDLSVKGEHGRSLPGLHCCWAGMQGRESHGDDGQRCHLYRPVPALTSLNRRLSVA